VRDLIRIIDIFGTFECQEMRDKIYCIQGMIHWVGRIDVNYSKPVLEIYFDVLRKAAEHGWENSIDEHMAFSETLRRYLMLDYEIEEGLMEKFIAEDMRNAINADTTRRQRFWRKEPLQASLQLDRPFIHVLTSY
jgi:hypothetical protein